MNLWFRLRWAVTTRGLAILGLLLLGLSAAFAEAVTLLPPEPLGRLAPFGGLTSEMVAVTGRKFEFAWRASAVPGAKKRTDQGAVVEITRTVPRGHCLALTFTARGTHPLDNGQHRLLATFARSAKPFTTALTKEWTIGNEWEDYKVAFRTVEECRPGTHQLSLFLGHGEQVIELAGLRLTDLGDLEPVSTGLPEGMPY